MLPPLLSFAQYADGAIITKLKYPIQYNNSSSNSVQAHYITAIGLYLYMYKV